MDNSILRSLLKEYENIRINNSEKLLQRKSELYLKNPRLKEIENTLNSISISTAKLILQKNNASYIKDLKSQISTLKKERISILKAIGKDESYLEPIYSCGLCKDTGYILNAQKTKMCNCLKQKLFDIEYNKSNVSNLDKENFKNFNIRLYSDKADESKYSSSLSPRENIEYIKNISKQFIDNFDNTEEKNLIFSGGTGLGKTFMANCIVNELLKNGKTVLYQTAPVMLDSIISNIFGKNTSAVDISESLITVDLLVIDDLGTETMNSMKFTELYKIINTRLLNQHKITKTIISTNLDLQNLYNTYDERLVSRFVGHYNAYRFYGDDIRFKKQ